MTRSRPSAPPSHPAESPSDPWRPTPLIGLSAVFHAALAAGVIRDRSSWPKAFGLALANQAVVGACCMMPRSPLPGPVVHRLDDAHAHAHVDDRPAIALTFDDGPDPEVTPRILDLLDRHRARATFFCIGRRAERFPALVREIVERGHRVENHTQHHYNTFAFRGYRGMEREILLAQETLAEVTGRRPVYFRAPAGMRSPLLDPLLHRLGLTLVAWTRRGYDTVSGDPDRVVPRLVRRIAPGDILLLHDGNGARDAAGRPVAVETLARLLDLFERRGWGAIALPPDLGPPRIRRAD